MPEPAFNASLFVGDEKYTIKYQTKYAALFAVGETVLDLGCGLGTFLSLLKKRGVHGIGVDAFPDAVAACRERGLDVAEADLFAFLPETDRTFDGVFCSHIIEHLQPQDAIRFLNDVFRVLNPGGRCIIITPNFRDIEVVTDMFWLDVTHVRPYPVRLLRALLEHAGFTVSAAGIDHDTKRRMPKRRFWLAPAYILYKLRFGKYYGSGDSFIIGKRTFPHNASN
jgi:SAM-dependent methyltransferase